MNNTPSVAAPAEQPRPSGVRFHDLDALRATAMLLGIVLHCLLFLIPDPFRLWPVHDAWGTSVEEINNPYVHGYLIIHGFRMPLFFLISGFFTAMLWERRGLRRLIDHRLKRIVLPLALGAITIVPICVLLWTTFVSDPITADKFGEFSLVYWPISWLSGIFDIGFFDFGFYHLWFLWLLILLVAIFAVLVRLGIQFKSRVWWGLIPLSVLPMYLMEEIILGPDTSAGVDVDPVVLGFYTIFFLFGAFYYQRGLTAKRWWTLGLGPALVAYILALLFLAATDYEPGVDSDPEGWAWLGTNVFQSAFAWLMSFGMMGLFSWIAAKGRPWVRYMSDSSYWLYLWHVPLVVIGQWLLDDAGISPHLKFWIIFAGVTAILLITYHWGVRYTPIGTLLNGKRTRTPATPPPSSPTAPVAQAP